jgi:hypothetical protein
MSNAQFVCIFEPATKLAVHGDTYEATRSVERTTENLICGVEGAPSLVPEEGSLKDRL